MTGTLNLADMATKLAAVNSSRPVLAALAFLTVGVSLKAAIFPLHQWMPNAYTYAPSAVTALLAATATVSLYALIRFYFTIFGESLVFEKLPCPKSCSVCRCWRCLAPISSRCFKPISNACSPIRASARSATSPWG